MRPVHNLSVARQRNVAAMKAMVNMSSEGKGVPTDDREAVPWCKQGDVTLLEVRHESRHRYADVWTAGCQPNRCLALMISATVVGTISSQDASPV